MGNRRVRFTNSVLVRMTDNMRNWLEEIAESKDGSASGVVREIVKDRMNAAMITVVTCSVSGSRWG